MGVGEMEKSNEPTRREYLASIGAVGFVQPFGINGLQFDAIQDDYPSETVTFVAWASQGGGSDTIVRQGYVRSIRENDLFPVDVEAVNRPGGGGEAGMKYVLNQDPDGHTVLNVTTNIIITPLSRDIDVTYEDFTPIARMGIEPIMLVAQGDDDRFSNMEEFREYAQNNRVTVATFDVGTQDHTAAFLLRERSDMNMEIVPFSGGGEQLSALMGGQVDAMIAQPSEVASQAEAGDIELLLHFSETELDNYPDVPYVSEVFDFSIEVEQLRGAVVHGETPEERVEWLRDKFEEIADTEEFAQYAEQNEVNPAFLRGEEFGEYLDEVNQQFTEVFRQNNLGIFEGEDAPETTPEDEEETTTEAEETTTEAA